MEYPCMQILVDAEMPYTMSSYINVKSRHAVFYTKTFNIENQIGAGFKRTSS